MTAADFTAAEMFWATVCAVALAFVGMMLALVAWVIGQYLRSRGKGVDWENIATGVDVLGDGGRRLD